MGKSSKKKKQKAEIMQRSASPPSAGKERARRPILASCVIPVLLIAAVGLIAYALFSGHTDDCAVCGLQRSSFRVGRTIRGVIRPGMFTGIGDAIRG